MSGLSTHVLDTSRGLPAAGVPVALDEQSAAGAWSEVTAAITDVDGRVKALLPDGRTLAAGTYRLRFDTGAYFASRAVPAFFPVVEITFIVGDPSRHHHVPLLISPFGYSTYRGS